MNNNGVKYVLILGNDGEEVLFSALRKRNPRVFNGKFIGSSGIWSDGHNLHYINSKHDEVQLRTVGNSLILSCSVLVES